MWAPFTFTMQAKGMIIVAAAFAETQAQAARTAQICAAVSIARKGAPGIQG